MRDFETNGGKGRLVENSPFLSGVKMKIETNTKIRKSIEQGYIRSITTDNGTELAKHKELAEALGTKIYFAHPYSSWEKGLIEYTNKLYRQYIPKGVSFDNYTEEQIKQIQYKINARPRNKLGFMAPVQIFFLPLQT